MFLSWLSIMVFRKLLLVRSLDFLIWNHIDGIRHSRAIVSLVFQDEQWFWNWSRIGITLDIFNTSGNLPIWFINILYEIDNDVLHYLYCLHRQIKIINIGLIYPLSVTELIWLYVTFVKVNQETYIFTLDRYVLKWINNL